MEHGFDNSERQLFSHWNSLQTQSNGRIKTFSGILFLGKETLQGLSFWETTGACAPTSSAVVSQKRRKCGIQEAEGLT